MENRSKAGTQELPPRGDSRPSIDAVPYRISVGGGRRNLRNTQLIETLEDLGRVTAAAVEKIERDIGLDAERSWQFVLGLAVGTIGVATSSDRADAVRCVELVQRASAALSAGGVDISSAQVLWLMQSYTGSFAPLAAVVAISETRSYQDLCPRGLVQRVRAWIKS